jgi:membrane protein
MKRNRDILTDAFHDWRAHNVPRMAAAVSFYAIFTLGPLLIVVLSVASFLLGHKIAQGEFYLQMKDLLGAGGARFLLRILHPASRPGSATLIGLVALAWGSTAVFVEMQASLNAIWGVRPKPGAFIRGMLRARSFSFGLVMAIGALLVTSLIVSALISALGHGISGFLPWAANLFSFANFILSFAIATFLFAAIYKILPDVVLEWKDVRVGAIFTSFLFTIGKHIIGLYLGKTSISSAYGAAGSLIVVVLWVYYSAMIFLFGAELTRVRARSRSSPAKKVS